MDVWRCGFDRTTFWLEKTVCDWNKFINEAENIDVAIYWKFYFRISSVMCPRMHPRANVIMRQWDKPWILKYENK